MDQRPTQALLLPPPLCRTTWNLAIAAPFLLRVLQRPPITLLRFPAREDMGLSEAQYAHLTRLLPNLDGIACYFTTALRALAFGP